MDPWIPALSLDAVSTGSTSSSTQPNQSSIELSSDQYLWSIEAKLKRVKGTNSREPQAKDIISALDELRRAQLLFHSRDQSNLPYIADADYIEDYDQATVRGIIQKKFCPERQALNALELRVLLNDDQLAKETATEESVMPDTQSTGEPQR